MEAIMEPYQPGSQIPETPPPEKSYIDSIVSNTVLLGSMVIRAALKAMEWVGEGAKAVEISLYGKSDSENQSSAFDDKDVVHHNIPQTPLFQQNVSSEPIHLQILKLNREERLELLKLLQENVDTLGVAGKEKDAKYSRKLKPEWKTVATSQFTESVSGVSSLKDSDSDTMSGKSLTSTEEVNDSVVEEFVSPLFDNEDNLTTLKALDEHLQSNSQPNLQTLLAPAEKPQAVAVKAGGASPMPPPMEGMPLPPKVGGPPPPPPQGSGDQIVMKKFQIDDMELNRRRKGLAQAFVILSGELKRLKGDVTLIKKNNYDIIQSAHAFEETRFKDQEALKADRIDLETAKQNKSKLEALVRAYNKGLDVDSTDVSNVKIRDIIQAEHDFEENHYKSLEASNADKSELEAAKQKIDMLKSLVADCNKKIEKAPTQESPMIIRFSKPGEGEAKVQELSLKEVVDKNLLQGYVNEVNRIEDVIKKRILSMNTAMRRMRDEVYQSELKYEVKTALPDGGEMVDKRSIKVSEFLEMEKNIRVGQIKLENLRSQLKEYKEPIPKLAAEEAAPDEIVDKELEKQKQAEIQEKMKSELNLRIGAIQPSNVADYSIEI